MIPPLWLPAAWRFVKPALPYIAVVLAIVAAYFWAHGRGVDAGEASRDGEVAALVQDRDTAIANTNALRLSVANQNAAVARMAQERTQALADADAAIAAGAAKTRAMSGLRAQLDALAKGRGVCEAPVADAVAKAWERLR